MSQWKNRILSGMAALFLAGVVFTACPTTNTEVEAPKSLSLTKTNAKTQFSTGDVFDTTGLVIYAKYEDGTKTELAHSECTFTIEDQEYISGKTKLTAAGTFSVKVSYMSVSKDYKITVISVDSYVTSKYKNLSAEVRTSQSEWNTGNCHDPKLFQDDDGTYYVYATDASCGNVEYTGMNVRYSKDLVNWTTSSKSVLQGHWDEDFLAWEGFSASSSEVKHSGSYSAVSWAPTVIKQNGLYYMYHGVNADVSVTNTSGTTSTIAASSIVLAIATSPLGPFYPASYISKYTGTDSDVKTIKDKLESLNVSYEQNFLVRYCPYYYTSKGCGDSSGNGILYSTLSSNGARLDGNEIAVPNYNECNNCRYGCIDPEFVFDVATGRLMTYTIGSNECYAVNYGSWLNGIVVAYVDAVSLKPVALGGFTLDDVTYSEGDELDFSLDKAATTTSYTISDRFALLGTPIIGGASSSSTPSNGASTAYEGAQVFYNSETGYYYIISSCGDLSWEYRCALGRSSELTGTYSDAGGQNMWLGTTSYANYHAVGSKIIGAHELSGEYSVRCQGGLSVLRGSDGKIYFANHTRVNYLEEYHFALQIHQLFFNEDKWPVLNQNDYYDDYTGYTSNGTEELNALSLSEIAGTYDTILTVRGTDKDTVANLGIYGGSSVTTKVNKADAVPTESLSMVIKEDGTVCGENYSGSVSLAADGYSAVITLKDSLGISLGTFKGYFMNAVDWNRKSGDNRTVTFTTLCSDSSASKAGEYFWGNRNSTSTETDSETASTFAEAFESAELMATYTMTVSDDAKDDLAWYLYPQYGTWSYIVDEGDGEETDAASVSGTGAWWTGTSANHSASYTIADGGTLTFYAITSDSTCTMILEGYSEAYTAAHANDETVTTGYADINYHDTNDGWGGAVSAWGTSDSRTAISANAAQSVKIVITRDGTTQVAKIYKK